MYTLCRNCAAFHVTGTNIGECRRNAPRPALVMVDGVKDHPDNVVAWPAVYGSCWCAEWEPAGEHVLNTKTGRAQVVPLQQPSLPNGQHLTYKQAPDTAEEGL